MKLNELKPNEGAKRSKKRVGRGPSAGQGKTAGKGTKGQHVRQGAGGHIYLQGGNLPFFRKFPFMRGEGFTPPNRVEFNEVNLSALERFDNTVEITPEVLAANLLSKKNNPLLFWEIEKWIKLINLRFTALPRELAQKSKLPAVVLKSSVNS